MKRWVYSLLLVTGCATSADVDVVVARDGGKDTGKTDAVTIDEGLLEDTGATPDSTSPKDTGASGDTGGSSTDTGSFDTAVPDTGVLDTGLLDTGLLDTGLLDTGVLDTGTPDTGTPDTAPVDTGTVDTGATDTGTTSFTALIYTDATSLTLGDATLADEAVLALGGTPTLADDLDFNSKFDAKKYDVIIVDSAYDYLPTGMDTRLSTFVTGGGRIVFAYWALDGSATLRTALQIATTTSFTTTLPVYRDPTSLFDLFAGPKRALPATLVGTDSVYDDGDRLTVTAAGAFLAARFSSATGAGAIAVTRSGKAIVNGFAPYEFMTQDSDADGIKDMRELYENEIAYVLSK
ncbi:MAG: hypothetical protein JNL79_27025 [Myxococcales bacterium]|nr:hypothetical protein [Myxococcales bacterium]